MNLKHKITILFVLFSLVGNWDAKAQCDDQLVERAIKNNGMDALFIREFKIEQEDKKKRKKQKRVISVAKYNVRLHEGILYRFNIEDDTLAQTKAILQLRKGNLLYGSTYDTEKEKSVKSFDFLCPEGGQHQVLLSFLDGNPGCAVGVLSAVISDSTVTSALMDSTKTNNILYSGIANYVDIASSTNPNGTLKVKISRGTIKEEGGLYKIMVDGNEPVIVDVTALDSAGNVTETFQNAFEVQKREMPNLSFLGSQGGLISKFDIIGKPPYIRIETWRWKDDYRLRTFTVSTNLSEVGISAVKTNIMSSRQIDIIKDLDEGDTFYIKDVVVEDKEGNVYNLPSLGFIITE